MSDPFALDLPATSPDGQVADVLADDVRPPAPVAPSPQVSPAAPPVERGGKDHRAKGIAIGGSLAEVTDVPELPVWPQDQVDEYLPDETLDASDLMLINRELNRCRSRLFRVSAALRVAQRELRDAELAYSRQMRRALISVSGGTAETRRAVAEMNCEPLENDMVVKQQVVEELRKRALDVRDDLKAVENLSHNARAQMNLH